jgi:hypothetical protein
MQSIGLNPAAPGAGLGAGLGADLGLNRGTNLGASPAAHPEANSGATSGATAAQPRLVKAAHEFEAQMMKELMEPLNRSDALTGSDADDDSGLGSGSGSDSGPGSGGALAEFASEALGRALSERGGFGIAASIVKQLSSSGNQKGTVPVTGTPHADTVIKNIE